MAGSNAQPWRWPGLDELDQPAEGFVPADRCREEPSAQPDVEEAERLLQQSRRDAERLVSEAEQRAEQIGREARIEALEESRRVFDAVLRETVEEHKVAFAAARRTLLQQIEDAATQRFEAIERDLTSLVAMMVQKIIHQKIEADDAIVLNVVKAAVEQAAGAHRFTVRVATPDEELVRHATAELLAVADGAEQIEFIADDAVGRCGCIVETERGRFDARIEAQIELLAEEIKRVTGEGDAE